MDHFRQHHLSAPFHMSQTDIRKYLSWQPVVLPPLKLTRQVLRESPDSAPFHDRPEYRFLRILADEHLDSLAQMYQRWYQGKTFPLYFGVNFMHSQIKFLTAP